MRITIEDLPEVQVGNKGVLIRIRDENDKNMGKLWVGQTNVRWAKGRVPEKNAKKLSVKEFVDYLNELPSN